MQPDLEHVYPQPLRNAEDASIQERRQHSGVDTDAPRVGVALSGGGIRSATFCLGVFQALARQKLLGRIDFLSTVSGGGYFGSFFGALFRRQHATTVGGVEATLADSNSWPVRWLRENGRYLSPNGAGGLWLFAAAMLRNAVTIHIVLLTFLLVPLSVTTLLSTWMSSRLCLLHCCLAVFGDQCVASIWWTPLVLLPLATILLTTLPGTMYWLTYWDWVVNLIPKWPLLRATKQPLSAYEKCSALRTRLTSILEGGLIASVALLLLAGVDSVGQALYWRWAAGTFPLPGLWAACTTAGVALVEFGKQLTVLLDKLPTHRAVTIPLNLVALLGAVIWIGLILISLAVVTRCIACQWNLTGLTVVMIAAGVLSLLAGRFFGFINLSSQQQLYAARLKRAYIGASNPLREKENSYAVTDPLPGDDVPLDEYQPYRQGGPLHLINVTVNETVSGKSQIEQRDRKGLSMAVGPCGVSVNAKDHALWTPGMVGREVQPIIDAKGRPFSVLHGDRQSTATTSQHEVESLSLGNWVSVSGAAFTTGMGMNTRLGMSLLLGLANVRLGYWWDCGVAPKERSNRTRPGLIRRRGANFASAFPVQSYLFDELLARFHGPARKRWYLSDGGHFENTACYELIRRRVPFMLVIDAGQDSAFTFEDVANLVRKARIDFSAEVEFLHRRSSADVQQRRAVDPVPALEDLVHPELFPMIGPPEDVAPISATGSAEEGSHSNRGPYAARHAMLARVRYPDTPDFSWMLFLKPSITGDEPLDVLQYQTAHPDFPQQSTADQFFDEAQWESYRKLGEHIASLVFRRPGDVASGVAAWAPYEMRPPPQPATTQPAQPSAS